MGEGKGIGLVLAGGGGKGAYQVGVLKVLQEQGLLEDVTAISVHQSVQSMQCYIR